MQRSINTGIDEFVEGKNKVRVSDVHDHLLFKSNCPSMVKIQSRLRELGFTRHIALPNYYIKD